jgi:hypothetical protein
MHHHEAAPQPRSSAWETAITVLQEVTPPSVPQGAHARRDRRVPAVPAETP